MSKIHLTARTPIPNELVIKGKIEHKKRTLQDRREAEESAKVLEQRKQDLANLKATANNLESGDSPLPNYKRHLSLWARKML